MSPPLDRRTRRDSERQFITPGDFFAREVPKLIDRNGRLVAKAMTVLGARPLTVQVAAESWSFIRAGDAIQLQRISPSGAIVIHLTPDQFSDWAQNQMALNGFMVSRNLEFRNGSPQDISLWDSLWIALLEGWPVTAEDLSFRDRRGGTLDLSTAFTPDEDPEDIAHFLREAGYLRLRGWLNPADLAVISTDMDKARPLYREGDGRSWWATLADGTRACVRLQEFVQYSPTTARLLCSDPWHRMLQILEGADKLARKPVEGRIIEALFKPVGVVAGPSDLSFHRDCHLGRHAYVCSRLTFGIALTPSSEENGLLQVVAGSHRACMPADVARTHPYLPVINLPTAPGDISVHLSCTLHASTPPVIAERRVMYTEAPLVSLEDGGVPADTSVNAVRERVNDILRDQPTP
jgi:hypothetical protein